LKKYFDNELCLNNWSQQEIDNFKQKATECGKIVGQFFSTISDNNVIELDEQALHGYIHSFWEIVSNHNVVRRISRPNFSNLLVKEPPFSW